MTVLVAGLVVAVKEKGLGSGQVGAFVRVSTGTASNHYARQRRRWFLAGKE